MPNKIHLNGDYRAEEANAAATITPGMLVEQIAAGTVQAHSTQGGYAEKMFALEDALQGNTIDDDYSAADLVFMAIGANGSVFQGWLLAGEDVSIGDKLVSNGDGMLIAEGSVASGVSVKQIVGEAMEAVDLSGSGAVNTRIDVRVAD